MYCAGSVAGLILEDHVGKADYHDSDEDETGTHDLVLHDFCLEENY